MIPSENNETESPVKQGVLYLVSTPIGNDDDITIRALRVLKQVDIVVCEEAKIGARTLHKLNLAQKMELLNEQNEFTKTPELIALLESGKDLALISDCGTPVFADPGLLLVQACIRKDISMVVVPGVSSIMAAVVRSGFSVEQFIYAGFMPRTKDERILQLRHLSTESKTVVLLETPYRLMPLLDATIETMPERHAYIGCNLTMPFETHHYGTFAELHEKFLEMRFKGEFVIVFEGAGSISDVIEKSKERNLRKVITKSTSKYDDRQASGYNDLEREDKPRFRRRDTEDGERERRPRDSRSEDRERSPRYSRDGDRDRRPRDSRDGDRRRRPDSRDDRGTPGTGLRKRSELGDRDSKPRVTRDGDRRRRPEGSSDRRSSGSGDRRRTEFGDRDRKPRDDRGGVRQRSDSGDDAGKPRRPREGSGRSSGFGGDKRRSGDSGGERRGRPGFGDKSKRSGGSGGAGRSSGSGARGRKPGGARGGPRSGPKKK